MNDPKVTIVLPTYNGEKYLKASIQSCLAQTHRNIELIIVDDCSTDTTPQIIRSFNDDRIKYIRNQTNQRLPKSLNIGFEKATGEFLTWTSDDNEFLPTAIQDMLDYLNKNPRVDFVYTDMEVVDLTTGQQSYKECTHWTFYFENSLGASYLYRRQVYETIGGYDPDFEWVEDYDYWLRIEKKFIMRRMPKALYLYGSHPNSLTTRKLYPVDIMAHILRYHHSYVSFDGLVESIGMYILKFPPFRSGSGDIWGPVLKKVSRLTPKLRMAFWSAVVWAICKKAGTLVVLVWKKFLRIFDKDRDFRAILDRLKGGDPLKPQVLCIMPFITMGGAEKLMQDIVRGLHPKGYEFHLFSFKQDEGPWINKFLSHFINHVVIQAVYDTPIYSDYLIKIIEKLKINMILVTNEHMTYKSLEKVRERFPGLKIIDIIHLERVGGTHKHISTMAAPYLDRRVCISGHLLTYMAHQYGTWGISAELAQRLTTIHNGTDVAEFTPDHYKEGAFRGQYNIPAQKKIISFAARMAHEKNPFLFVEIARNILDQGEKNVHFVMAGDGPLLGHLKVKIMDYGLQEYFTLPGAVTDMGGLLKDSFIFVVVSTHEGIPLSIQEAMHMGVPVVSTRVGAIHEIIKDGVNGFLVMRDANLVENMSAHIAGLLKNEHERAAMSAKAREAAYPEFALETMCRRYQELFAEVLR